MLRKIKMLKMLLRTQDNTERLQTSAITPAGYQLPEKAEELTAVTLRKNCLKKLWETSLLPAGVYQQLYQIPVYTLLERVQRVPATEAGKWSYAGGFADLTLNFTTCAVRLSRGCMFPPGAAPEEQAAQSVMWSAVIFWSSLFHHLPLLAALEGETVDGVKWQPGLSVPGKAYRFRFRLVPPDNGQALAALAAGQLMPTEAISWLAGNDKALYNLAGALWNNQPEMPLIQSILKQAADRVASPLSVTGNMPASISTPSQLPVQPTGSVIDNMPVTANIPAPAAGNVPASISIPPALPPDLLGSALSDGANEVTEAVRVQETGNADADTDALLSLFSNTETEPDTTALAEAGEKTDVSEDAGAETVVLSEQFRSGSKTEGTRFLRWLRTGIAAGTINVNGATDRLHVVAGYVFLPVPGIFFDYLKFTGGDTDSRENLQQSFEALKMHKMRENNRETNRKRFYFGRLYESTDRSGKFKAVKGYLITGRTLFVKVPGDSQYIVFP